MIKQIWHLSFDSKINNHRINDILELFLVPYFIITIVQITNPAPFLSSHHYFILFNKILSTRYESR